MQLLLRLVDPFAAPFAWLAALILRPIRLKWMRMPASRAAVQAAGILPVRDHYYEPQIRFTAYNDQVERDLPGIDLDEAGQRAFLSTLTYAHEVDFPREGRGTDYFHFGPANNQFGPGDAEVLYQIVRATKPRRIVEVGSGWSSKIVAEALEKNRQAGYPCRHICIEPYEAARRGMEHLDIELIDRCVEDVPMALFEGLGTGDILFVDSSHIVRPQGDVLFIYLQILPRLKSGVIVHVHDIFTPRNYPRKWIVEDQRLWNEQYVLEALLTGGTKFRVLLANNWMHSKGMLKSAAPYVRPEHRPGSFWMRKLES